MRTYDDATKAKVILEWQAGSGTKALARDHNIPHTTVRSWVKDLTRAEPALPPAPKTKTVRELAGELAAESFNAAIAILRLAQDREWLRSQNAESLAILFGVNADKLYRLLPAFGADDIAGGRVPDADGGTVIESTAVTVRPG